MKKRITITLISLIFSTFALARPWVQDDSIFNPGGIPSLPFSQPRLADLDNDGDADLALGKYSGSFSYHRNQHFVTGIHNPENATQIHITIRPNPVINNYVTDCRIHKASQVIIRICGMDGKIYA